LRPSAACVRSFGTRSIIDQQGRSAFSFCHEKLTMRTLSRLMSKGRDEHTLV
jgi:hypothetical protein